ncbi:subunit delta of ATP synthase [Chloropicon primus]|uniref:Subunit delta of ATP synthase n=1 Tax=Chloropicon primus TaxID=1764295 RepID=A0A5B8MRF4_9CHLO|nr:subunit delta of ATP synthase [Chloropicon primus]UPR01210.1 subunit delta of ATP synthase [Chloropicon primus]|eukprot:QDZ21990.1 subunit delta of ATP synthase [Chloropicon primus]
MAALLRLSRAACATATRTFALRCVGGSGLSSTSAHAAVFQPAPAFKQPFAMYSQDPFEGTTDLEPPVKMYGTSAKYAAALWSAATKAKVLDDVATEVAQIIELKNGDEKFSAFLDDPTVPVEKKIEGLQKVFEAGKFTDITKNFFFVMAENGRLEELPMVAEQYQELVYASRGEVLVTVTSAIPLSPAQENECKKVLTEKVLKKGEKLVLNVKIDRKILGGLIFDIGEKHIDMSIEARIRKIENLLREAVGSA